VPLLPLLVLASVLTVLLPAPASGQIVEAVGSRALGMGGAFVAVANDSSATWWNPGALAAGQFLDLAVAFATTDSSDVRPANRNRVAWVALTLPPAGVSYYHLRITEIGTPSPTVTDGGNRQDEQGFVPVRTLETDHFGITVLHTLVKGVHAGATVRYVKGTVANGAGNPARSGSDLLGWGSDLEDGRRSQAFDLDAGVLAAVHAFRAGLLIRNAFEADFDAQTGPPVELPRQVRVGGAFDGDAIGTVPLIVSFDADVMRYPTVAGDRRVVAFGVEQKFGKRVLVRGGGRFNTVGARERAATAGASVALLPSIFVDGHAVWGGSIDDRGWGMAARVSF
jgi:hypothetical protein